MATRALRLSDGLGVDSRGHRTSQRAKSQSDVAVWEEEGMRGIDCDMRDRRLISPLGPLFLMR